MTQNILTTGAPDSLPVLISKAAQALARAATPAEILEIYDFAKVAYDTAKSFAKVKAAHDEVRAACRKTMADALIIETQAQCRLADEYEAAQARGEVRPQGYNRHQKKLDAENGVALPGLAEIGLTREQITIARQVREAEKAHPGVFQKIINERLEADEAPTRYFVTQAVSKIMNWGSRELHRHRNDVPASPRRQGLDARNEQIVALADGGLKPSQVATEVGAHPRTVNQILEHERIRREAVVEAAIDPATLSLSAQEKLAIAIRQHTRKLDIEFEQRVLAEVQKRMAETVLPAYDRDFATYQEVIKARRGVMDRATYRKIISCLHPDRVSDPGLKKRYEEAFRLFSEMEVRLLNEKEHPTPTFKMPRSYAEWAALKQKVAEERRAAKRNGGKP